MSLIGALIGLIVAAVTFWLLSMVAPTWVAAIVALVLFLICTFGDLDTRIGRRRV